MQHQAKGEAFKSLSALLGRILFVALQLSADISVCYNWIFLVSNWHLDTNVLAALEIAKADKYCFFSCVCICIICEKLCINVENSLLILMGCISLQKIWFTRRCSNVEKGFFSLCCEHLDQIHEVLLVQKLWMLPACKWSQTLVNVYSKTAVLSIFPWVSATLPLPDSALHHSSCNNKRLKEVTRSWSC